MGYTLGISSNNTTTNMKKYTVMVFNYFKPLWSGSDGRPSLRSSLAIIFSLDFISNLSFAVYKWEDGKSFEGLAMVLGIEAGLIVALLGLTTYQNLFKKDNNG